MKLSVINCEHFDRKGGPCPIVGAFTTDTCYACKKRVPILRPYQFVLADIDSDGEPEPSPVDFLLCKERLREEWDAEWQERLKAAAVRQTKTGYMIPLAVYDEAMKHRK